MWLAILKLLSTALDWFNRQSIKQDGKNEEKLEALQEVEKRWEKANEINNEPIADDDVLILLRPEERTADNLRLLQDSKPDVSNPTGNDSNKGGEETEGLGTPTNKTQKTVRQVMPVKFPKLPMPVQFTKPKRKIGKVFLHCSASDNPKHDNPETIEEWHIARKFAEIGYHFYINQAGEVFQCRNIEKVPAAQKGHNTGSIAICCGGLTVFSQAQLTALYMLCKRINAAYNGQIEFWGHSEVEPNKTCPVYPWRTILKLKDRKMNVD